MLFAGCFSDPDLKTALRPDGLPEVLSLVSIDSGGGEAPLFCKYVGDVLDEKAPGLVQGSEFCPKQKSDFVAAGVDPLGFSLRIVFDELLDGDAVETLDCPADEEVCYGHINTTLPVTLMCGGAAMTYDGYYYPNGNAVSFPVGPSLVVTPDDVVATGADCTVVINDVVKDKSGNTVATGPELNQFTFTVDALAVTGTDPVDAADVMDREVIAPDGAVAFFFNALIDPASVTAAEVEITNLDTNLPVPSDFDVVDNEIDVFGVAALPAGNYAATIKSGATIADVAGGMTTLTADETVRFVVQ